MQDEVRDWIIPPDFDHVSAEATHLINEADSDKVTNIEDEYFYIMLDKGCL